MIMFPFKMFGNVILKKDNFVYCRYKTTNFNISITMGDDEINNISNKLTEKIWLFIRDPKEKK